MHHTHTHPPPPHTHTPTHTRVCSLCGAHTFCIRHFAPLKPTKKILIGFSGYQVLCGGALVFKPKVEYYYAYVPRAEYEM